MSYYGPTSAFLLVGGRNLSSDTFTLDENVEQILEESHALGDSWEEHTPVGIGRITLEATGGIYDDRTLGMLEVLQEQGSTRQLVAFGMAGNAAGAESVLLDGTYAATWKRISSREGLTHAHATHTISGSYKKGRVLSGLAAITTDPGPGLGTSVDNSLTQHLPSIAITSSSVANPTTITTPVEHGLQSGDVILISGHTGATPALNGGDGYAVTVTGLTTFTIPENVTVGGTGGSFLVVSSRGATADLHVPALTLGGFTNLALTVEHSADDSAYVTLFTFTAVTAAGASQRMTTASLVNRYTRFTWDWAGAGSAQSAVAYVGLARP